MRTAVFAVTLAVTFGHEVHLRLDQKPLQSIMKKALVRHYRHILPEPPVM